MVIFYRECVSVLVKYLFFYLETSESVPVEDRNHGQLIDFVAWRETLAPLCYADRHATHMGR